ncbi:MAG: DUF1347 family protein [Chlamydiales bacterium]
MKKRLIIILVLFVGCATGSYYIFKPNPKSQAKLALVKLNENQFASAEKILRKLSNQQTTYPLNLYKGYLEQARGRYLESDLYLKSLLKHPSKKWKKEISVEILLASATNAFFEQRDQEIYSLVDSAYHLIPHHSHLFFFLGLSHYLQKHYRDALDHWNSFETISQNEEKSWMGTMIEKLFPPHWRRLHTAHCLIEEGYVLSGREILEQEHAEIKNQDLASLATLFLGFSYLKEARKIPLDERESYYTLAQFYFQKSGIATICEREKQLIANDVEKEIEELVAVNLDQEKQTWGLNFIDTLIDWKSEKNIASTAETLSKKLLSQELGNEVLICKLIHQKFAGTGFHSHLTQNLLNGVILTLKERGDHLGDVFSMVENLSSLSRSLTKEMAIIAVTTILDAIRQDNKHLEHTRTYLEFWKRLDRGEIEREELASHLITQAILLWQQENQEHKGKQLMDLALELSVDKLQIEKKIGSCLSELYKFAEGSNSIDRLLIIFDAMDHFQLNTQELTNPSKLANHLADADYLYHAHNYGLSKAHAMWVLKLDPENQLAQRLIGLSAFYLGEYSVALSALTKLEHPDDDVLKILILSQVFASQEQSLCQIDPFDASE